MGADQHITDPDDRADLAARAHELMSEHGSLRKVREALSVEPVTMRVCGERRLFSTDTIRTWIGEARAAEAYIELLSLAEQRVDSNTRLSLLAATMWEHVRLRSVGADGSLSTAELISALDFMRKVEVNRMDLLGLKAPIKVQQVDSDPAGEMNPDMVAAVAAAKRRAEARQQALVDDQYPGATVVPARRPTTRRRDNRRTS